MATLHSATPGQRAPDEKSYTVEVYLKLRVMAENPTAASGIASDLINAAASIGHLSKFTERVEVERESLF